MLLEINPFPFLITLFDNKIVLLDMDQNRVAWTFSAEGDFRAVGYTADDATGYCAQSDALLLLNMRNGSSSEVSCCTVLLKGSGVFPHHPVTKTTGQLLSH